MLLAVFIGLWYVMHYWGLRHLFDKAGSFLIPTPLRSWACDLRRRPIARDTLHRGLKWTAIVALIGWSADHHRASAWRWRSLMSQAKWVERVVCPYLVALQAIPILAIVPLIYSVFGDG